MQSRLLSLHATDSGRPRSASAEGRPHRKALALRQAELTVVLFAVDVAAAALASFGTLWLWSLFDRDFVPTIGVPSWQFAFPLVWVALLRIVGGADVVSPRFGRRSIVAVSRTYLAVTSLTLATFFLFPFFMPRGSSLLMPAVAGVLALASRFAFLRFLSTNILRRRVVVLGTDEAARRTAALVQGNSAMPYDIECFYDESTESGRQMVGLPVRALPTDLWRALADLDADLVVVGHTSAVPQRLLAELVRCYEHGIETVPATLLYEQLSGRVMVSALEADWYADLPTGRSGVYAVGKRAFDVVLALMGLVLLAPVMALIAIAVIAGSGRPILLRQRRVGQRGEVFTLYKFRSMRANAEVDGEPRWASFRDPRQTTIGRVLRRYRLDELPQFWNILRGQMSVVGPRPERPEFVDRLAAHNPLYRARLLVRPGLTGWAQVMYPYAGSIEENLVKLEYDLYYIRHLGPVLDLSILFRTVGIVIGALRPEFLSARVP